ncbi:MAG: hypothetical protein V3T98_02425 [Candidatus Paceibacterota bacterium]
MAIIIEEEKRKINWFAIVINIFLIALLGTVIYYLFFTQLPLIEVVLPIRVQSLSQLANIEFDPQRLFSHPIYDILQQIIPSLSVTTSTRTNPFMP